MSAGGCGVSYQTVTEYQTVSRTVMQQQVSTVTESVPVTTYQTVQKSGNRQVAKSVPVTSTVDVTTYQAVQKTGTRQVARSVPVTNTVDVTTMSYQQQARQGMRTVCKTVPVTSTVDVTTYQAVQKTGHPPGGPERAGDQHGGRDHHVVPAAGPAGHADGVQDRPGDPARWT